MSEKITISGRKGRLDKHLHVQTFSVVFVCFLLFCSFNVYRSREIGRWELGLGLMAFHGLYSIQIQHSANSSGKLYQSLGQKPAMIIYKRWVWAVC